MNLWLPFTCNVKRFEEFEKMGRRLMYFASLTKIIRDGQL